MPEEQKESTVRTAKMRTLGNIRLIAELFKKSVVPEKIVHMCVQDLIGDAKHEPTENNVEASLSCIAAKHGCTHSTHAGCGRHMTSAPLCLSVRRNCTCQAAMHAL